MRAVLLDTNAYVRFLAGDDRVLSCLAYFGLIKAALKRSGQPIPLNDVWIAAHALETGAVLVTYDTHFTAVPGLRTWDELA
ncbi:MAG: PIN domain-containing protein [Candidatus Aminicenantes bacterium]|nr:PIN domain-containing protein [Candidatus Aminicenantes bacterium]